ncbi:MAG: DNA primase DnaG [Promethearchaeota archaeon]
MTKGINESIDQNSAKYNIVATFIVNGVVEVQDVVGALFGQTEGLLDSLELRELQKTGRIGRIVVNASSEKGLTTGDIIIPSSLDRTETAILAATLETVDRVGPCRATLQLKEIKDLRKSKLAQIEARAKELLKDWKAEGADRDSISDKIHTELEKESIITWNGLPAGDEIDKATSIIIVEGRNDIQQLLKIGVKNTVAVNGTSIPKAIIDLTHKKECTAFLDGDRGGDMILNELLQVSKIKYYARAPLNREVEELTSKDMVRCLQNKRPIADLYKERKSREERGHNARDSHRNSSQQNRSSPKYARSTQRGVRDRGNRDRRDSQRDSRSSRPGQRTRSGHRDSSRERYSKPKISIPKDKIEPLVKEIISSNSAIALDEKYEQISRTSNVKIFDELNPSMKTVVIDGVVTQRFLDQAIKNQVKHIVAVNINKYLKVQNPAAIELYYFSDFL